MIVPPLAVKLPIYAPLFSLWEQARAAFERSDLIVAVGYSFADADAYLTRMLELAVQQNPNLQIIVNDVDARVSNKLSARLTAHVQGFRPERVLTALTGCEEFLPKLAEILVPSASPKRRSRRAEPAAAD